ncbi:MAG: hypothetical protein IPP93_12030 [Chitinophagaceae bacterium]|nr:hypothetical protein [Chitinophagaceae bacterium]
MTFVTRPTLNAALAGYHIILIPPPLVGVLPGVTGIVPGPVNKTLLSFTCSMACGVTVLIPTLPVCAWAKIA